ncbi:MAG: hypothetical protein ACYSR5_10715 [Planctomycetota bacterium]
MTEDRNRIQLCPFDGSAYLVFKERPFGVAQDVGWATRDTWSPYY